MASPQRPQLDPPDEEHAAPPPPPSPLGALPPELRLFVLRGLDVPDLLSLRATDRRHRAAVTDECPDVWEARHDARWSEGTERTRRRSRRRRRRTSLRGLEAWARASGWGWGPTDEPRQQEHEEEEEEEAARSDRWYDEFRRRSALDRSVEPRLEALDLNLSFRNEVWCGLMRDGLDIVDRLKKLTLCPPGMPPPSVVKARKVETGIRRCAAYREWKFLHDPSNRGAAHLEDGALTIAKFYGIRGGSEERFVLKELDDVAEYVEAFLGARLGPPEGEGSRYPVSEVLEEMKRLFRDGDRAAFRGNVDDYYNHRNSLIDWCLTFKTGIPITLAVIYASVVRRVCGVPMDIIGLPGHIVVGVPSDEADDEASRIFVDPFHHGRLLTLSHCRDIVAGYNVAFRDDMTRPLSNEEVWQRMLRNLHHSHSMQALAEDNAGERGASHKWKIAVPLRFFLTDYSQVTTNFGDLLTAPGWCPKYC
ncbi:hypothetical protein ACHAWF_011296 [Thalassiosira exigua]